LNLRVTQVALLLAAAAAILIIVDVLGTPAAVVALGVIVLGTLLAAPAGRGQGGGWWTLLAIGAALSVAGALLALLSDTVGGLVTLLGGVAVVSGAAMGFPLD
jgi:hypothetical protein